MKMPHYSSMSVAAGALAGLMMLFNSAPTSATDGVTIVAPQPAATENLVIDSISVGTFPVYDGRDRMTFTWRAYWPSYWPDYPNPKPADQAYRVAVWQNTTPLAETPTWVELHTSHHWIDDANPTRFTFDTFLDVENLCQDCPSMIVVQPETIQYTPDIPGDSPYTYVSVTSPNASGVPALMKSSLFLIEGYTRLQDTKEKCPYPPNLQWLCLI